MVRNPIWYTSYLLSAVSFFFLNVMLAGGGASSADPGERSCWDHQSGAEGQTTSGEASHPVSSYVFEPSFNHAIITTSVKSASAVIVHVCGGKGRVSIRLALSPCHRSETAILITDDRKRSTDVKESMS